MIASQEVLADNWKSLLNNTEDIISNARRQGERHLSTLSSDQVDSLRWRAKHDKFFLASAVLGYKDLSINLHGHLSKWLAETQDDRFRLVLLPRSHFKTTIVTIADSIQITLPACDETDHYPFDMAANVRILLGHESAFGSSRFLYEITNHFCSNPVLMALFPECIPSPRIQRMNQQELELPRTERWAEPTFDTIGVGGRSQGRHYNIIKLDDIFGDKARDSKADRDTTIQWVDNIQAFFVNLPKDHLDFVGTRYSLDDVYAHIIRVYGKQLLRYIRRIEEPTGKDGAVAPIFPERFTTESLQILRKNKTVWAAQYVNDPVLGLSQFDRNWKRYYTFLSRNKIQIFTGTRNEIISLDDCDICIISDPAVTGKSGTLVTATDSKLRIFVLEAIKKEFQPQEFVNILFQLVLKYRQMGGPRTVAIEEILFMALYEPWLKREMQIRGVRFHFTPVKPKKVPRISGGSVDESKIDRVKGLAPYFSSGQIFFHSSQVDLIEEFDNFGATDDYHLLDAMAYGPHIWIAPSTALFKSQLEDSNKSLLALRDPYTGY